MKFSRGTLLTLALFSALFLLTQWLFIPGTYVQSRLGQALQAPKVFLQAMMNRHRVAAQLSELAIENQSLRGQLGELASLPSIIKESGKTYIYARVYSTYPFNNSDRLLINAGEEQGVTMGSTVLAKPGIFLGEIVAVHKDTSEVRTLYDPQMQMPVKIGSGTDSLLVGGHQVRLTLISKKKSAQSGQTVTTAAKQYPYGLQLGTTSDLRDATDNLFQEATLATPYSISELSDVYVVK